MTLHPPASNTGRLTRVEIRPLVCIAKARDLHNLERSQPLSALELSCRHVGCTRHSIGLGGLYGSPTTTQTQVPLHLSLPRTHACTHTHTHLHACIKTDTVTHTGKHTHKSACTPTDTQLHTNAHANRRTHTSKHMHAYRNRHTHTTYSF